MRYCERCREAEAVIALSRPGGSGPEERLCLPCAQARLADAWGWTGDFSPARLLLGMRRSLRGREPAARWDEAFCPRCGTALADYKDTGMLGCADCYESFAHFLEEVVRELHGAAYHRGDMAPDR